MNIKQARLCCAYSVRYKHEAQPHVLMPGQALPVYDISTFRRTGPEMEIRLVTMSVDESDEFIVAPGQPRLKRAEYANAKALVSAGHSGIEELLVVQQGEMFALGGASGISVLRPHRLPVGIGVFSAPLAWDDPRPQHEEHSLTLAQAVPVLDKLKAFTQRPQLMLMPRFYVEASDGTHEAWVVGDRDVATAPTRLKEVLLPVCPCPLGSDIELMELVGHVSRHLQAVGASGRIYLGQDLPLAGSPEVDTVIKEPTTSQQVKANTAPSPVLYSLPHGSEADYYAPLRYESRAKVTALYQGRDGLCEGEVLDMHGVVIIDAVDPRTQVADPLGVGT